MANSLWVDKLVFYSFSAKFACVLVKFGEAHPGTDLRPNDLSTAGILGRHNDQFENSRVFLVRNS